MGICYDIELFNVIFLRFLKEFLQKFCIFAIGKDTDKEVDRRLTPMDYEYKHQAKGAVCQMNNRQEKVKQLVLLSRKASVRTEEVLPEQVKQVVLHEGKRCDIK